MPTKVATTLPSGAYMQYTDGTGNQAADLMKLLHHETRSAERPDTSTAIDSLLSALKSQATGTLAGSD